MPSPVTFDNAASRMAGTARSAAGSTVGAVGRATGSVNGRATAGPTISQSGTHEIGASGGAAAVHDSALPVRGTQTMSSGRVPAAGGPVALGRLVGGRRDPVEATRYRSLSCAVGATAVMLALVVVMLWSRRRRLAELGRGNFGELPGGTTGPDRTGGGEHGSDERKLGSLLLRLKNPGFIFLFFFALYRLIPVMTMGAVETDRLDFLKLIVVVTGIYLVAECVFTLVVDYFLVSVQGVDIPRIFYQIIKILAFVLVYLPVLSTQFGLDITPLLTTSAVLTMVIGLALQDSLGNLFSGIAMQISNPFKVGDWVLVAGREGRVTDVNWRATTIKTFSNDYLIIPNSNISKAEIQNFSRPTKVHARFLEIGLAYTDSPERVESVLIEAVLSADGVLPRPKPQVMLARFNDFTIDYVVKFFILDYSRYPTIESDIRFRFWYALKRAGLEVPFPVRTIEYRKEPDPDEERIARTRLLARVDFLQPISDAGLKQLAEAFHEEIYPGDFNIVEQGEEGESFYIIRRGRAEVLVMDESSSEPIRMAELGPSQHFGEMSLLTGEKRSATVHTLEEVVTLTVGKDAFRSILAKEPKLAERISEIIVNRKKATRDEIARRADRAAPAVHGSGTSTMSVAAQKREQQNLLKKIILFFGM